MTFDDRTDAGHKLADRLRSYRDQDVVVLGLPRGGVPVAFAVAQTLRAPLDVILVRKLGVPCRPELAFGAVGEGGVRVVDVDFAKRIRLTAADIAEVEARQRSELHRRSELLRGTFDRIPLTGRTALIVDDGVATGSTARAACQVARSHGAARVVLAVPICSPRRLDELSREADEVVCLESPANFFAVGQGYHDFRQVSDDQVRELLARARRDIGEPAGGPRGTDKCSLSNDDVKITAEKVQLAGHLAVPEKASGIVLFAHGSGSSRHSPRNRYVAELLNKSGLATLLFDLLGAGEEGDRALVFDIELLARRLVAITLWLQTQPTVAALPIGYFGASTGAAAALRAATDPTVDVRAVVSRGGRPDLAGQCLGNVHAPTLLIVGGRDEVVLDLNRKAQAAIPGHARIEIVPGATHVFEEPGALEHVASLASRWFLTYLTSKTPR